MTSEEDHVLQNVKPRVGHVAAVSNDKMIIWGGYKEEEEMQMLLERYLNPAFIHVYHPEFKYWTRHETKGDIPPGTSGASACIVDTNMYVFAGHESDGNSADLYSLDLCTLQWTCLTPECPVGWEARWPSPRDKFALWLHEQKLYCFGGFGPHPRGYLNDNGVFVYEGQFRGWNNQLLIYDIPTKTWSNPVCKGTPPSPRAAHAAANSGHTVFIFGGRHGDSRLNDVHCLDLNTLRWSGELFIEGPIPCPRSWHTFTAVTDELAFLYGGYSNSRVPLSDAWMFNTQHLQWSQLTARTDRPRLWHTCCCLSDDELLVFGGCQNDILNWDIHQIHSNEILSFQLKPSKLLRLCLEKVYSYKDYTYNEWGDLPGTLKSWLVQRDLVTNKKSSIPPSPSSSTSSQGACSIS